MAAKRSRTGKVRTILLTPAQDARLDRLCEETGLCRNQLVRLVADAATPEDIRALLLR